MRDPAVIALLAALVGGACTILAHLLSHYLSTRKERARTAAKDLGPDVVALSSPRPPRQKTLPRQLNSAPAKKMGCGFFVLWVMVAVLTLWVATGPLYLLMMFSNSLLGLQAFANGEEPPRIIDGDEPVDQVAEFLKRDGAWMIYSGLVGLSYALVGIVTGAIQRRLLISYLRRFWWWPTVNGAIWLILGMYGVVTFLKLATPGRLAKDVIHQYVLESYCSGCVVMLVYCLAIPVMFIALGNEES